MLHIAVGIWKQSLALKTRPQKWEKQPLVFKMPPVTQIAVPIWTTKQGLIWYSETDEPQIEQLSLALTPKLLFHIAYIGKRKELETVLIPSKDQTTLSLQTSRRWLWRDGETWTQGLLRERPWRVASGGREDFWRFKHFKLIRRDELCNRAFMIIISVYLVFYQIIKATEVAGEPFFFWSHTVLTVLIWLCWNLVKIYKQSRRKKSLLNKNNSFILKWFKQLSYIKRGKQRVAKGKKMYYYFSNITGESRRQAERKAF